MSANLRPKAPRIFKQLLLGIALSFCSVAAHSKVPSECVQSLLPLSLPQEALAEASEFISGAQTYLRRSESHSRKVQVAEELIALLDEQFGIQGYIHPYSEEGTVLVAIRVRKRQKCSSLAHWLPRMQCHMNKIDYQMGLIVSSGSHLESTAWVTDDPKLLALPMDSILLDRAGSVVAHEWVHVWSNLVQAQRERGELLMGEALWSVPVHVKSRTRLKSRSLERLYGGAAKGREGHWIEENAAYLKEGRFELAYGRAELSKLQEIAPRLSRAEIRQWSKQIQKRLGLAEEYLDDFKVFYEADVALLNRFLGDLRLESPDGERIVLRLADGSTLDFAMAGIEYPHDFLIQQRDHLVELAEIHSRAVLRLRQARKELRALTRR